MRFHHHHITKRSKRSGFTVFEAFISLILVSTAVSIAVPTLRVVNLQRKSINERVLATNTLANLAERLSVTETWNSLTPQKLDTYRNQVTKELSLKKSKLTIDLIESPKSAALKQVQIRLSWQNPYGEFVDPVLLSLWFYQMESTK
ncbi:hypothetical protein Mal35_56640 [Gimesia maris]|uniref:hypothetical protein n=1 Tax=Gimesia maris TaxID=122 RepID=UPI00118D1853|nr:hypothetical protein [Gimesia maris]QDT82171.1 hypothetical protein Mal35_56640 [Gimesia maris]